MNTDALYTAFREGEAAFRAELPEVDPYGNESNLGAEWHRGYRNARKAARFNATIAARIAR
jgi:hypothetical protein